MEVMSPKLILLLIITDNVALVNGWQVSMVGEI